MVTELVCSYCGVHSLEFKDCKTTFYIIADQNWFSLRRHHLVNLLILTTEISLEQKKVFRNSKNYSSSTDYLFTF